MLPLINGLELKNRNDRTLEKMLWNYIILCPKCKLEIQPGPDMYPGGVASIKQPKQSVPLKRMKADGTFKPAPAGPEI